MKHPFSWVGTMYLLEGLPFALVATVSMILYKNFDVSNTEITFYTSLLTIPWFLKPIIAPLLEGTFSKRILLLLTSFFMIIWILLLTICLNAHHFFLLSMIIFFSIACTGAIYDMNADGLYISNLDRKNQIYFIGIRTVSYHIGRLIVLGGVVYIASLFFKSIDIKLSWQLAFLCLSTFLILLFIYHYYTLPKDYLSSQKSSHALNHFINVFYELRSIPNLFHVVLFTVIYNFSENQLTKIVPLFLLDQSSHGGLAFSTADVSILIGVISIIGMLIGILASGFLLTKITLQQCLIPITLFACIINISYFVLSLFPMHSFIIVACVIFLTQLSFGLSNGLYMFYLLHTFGQSIYSMSLYALGTSIMGLSVLLAGAISGYMQSLLHYSGFFSWILFSGILVILYCHYLIQHKIINY